VKRLHAQYDPGKSVDQNKRSLRQPFPIPQELANERWLEQAGGAQPFGR